MADMREAANQVVFGTNGCPRSSALLSSWYFLKQLEPNKDGFDIRELVFET